MKRPSPLTQMTLALVGLCGLIVILADLFFGVLPDRDAQTVLVRKTVTEALAVQVSAMLHEKDEKLIQHTLREVVDRTPDIRSMAVRLKNGRIVVQAGDHARHWKSQGNHSAGMEQVTVPLNTNGERWGNFEIAFALPEGNVVWRFITKPIMVVLMFISALGTLIFGLYMRRALQHLDPASVIPERVQGAFDAMSEGVIVLDTRGRVLLTNKEFKGLHPEAATLTMGTVLSTVSWLAHNLPADLSQHPWALAMAQRKSNTGYTLEVHTSDRQAHHLVINCAPIVDPGGAVRGCVVSLDDVSQLYQAMAELNASKEKLQIQNRELELLATRDPMTGCLNRRAFYAAFEPLFETEKATNESLICLMVDIDHFKAVNDTHGHAVGDLVIQGVAKSLLDNVRVGDLVCRFGGEEFCVVLPTMGQADAKAFAERMRSFIERECGRGVRGVPNLHVTASLGLAVLSDDVLSATDLVDRADQALYRAKRGGRNRVCEFISDAPETHDSVDDRLDPLTGYLTLPGFRTEFRALLMDKQEQTIPFSAVKVGIDSYRTIVANQGQATADKTLLAVSGVLRECARPGDLLVRLDSEHLGVLAAGLSMQEALTFAERVRARVERGGLAADGGNDAVSGLTLSVGVDTLSAHAAGASTLMERAGKALLRARRDGANRVNRFSPEVGSRRAASSDSPATEVNSSAQANIEAES